MSTFPPDKCFKEFKVHISVSVKTAAEHLRTLVMVNAILETEGSSLFNITVLQSDHSGSSARFVLSTERSEAYIRNILVQPALEHTVKISAIQPKQPYINDNKKRGSAMYTSKGKRKRPGPDMYKAEQDMESSNEQAKRAKMAATGAAITSMAQPAATGTTASTPIIIDLEGLSIQPAAPVAPVTSAAAAAATAVVTNRNDLTLRATLPKPVPARRARASIPTGPRIQNPSTRSVRTRAPRAPLPQDSSTFEVLGWADGRPMTEADKKQNKRMEAIENVKIPGQERAAKEKIIKAEQRKSAIRHFRYGTYEDFRRNNH